MTATLLLPDFALILLGLVLRRVTPLSSEFWQGVEKLVYFILFPALLVHAILKTPIDPAATLPLVIGGWTVMAAGMLLGALPRPLFSVTPITYASVWQCSYRFNSYIALAVVSMLHGTEGIAAMGLVVGAGVPLANFASVWAIARHGEVGAFREILRNPLIWATLLGFALNLLGFAPPTALQLFLGRLADAAIALGLLAVGAALTLGQPPGMRALSIWLLLVKLIALPLCAMGIASVFGLNPFHTAILVLFAALPTASSAYILATRLGGDGQSVAWLISASTLLSMLTLPVWASWLG